jgi:hypothetical protein
MHALDKWQLICTQIFKTFFCSKTSPRSLAPIIVFFGNLNMASKLTELQKLQGHDDRVWHLAWSPNGKSILIIFDLLLSPNAAHFTTLPAPIHVYYISKLQEMRWQAVAATEQSEFGPATLPAIGGVPQSSKAPTPAP